MPTPEVPPSRAGGDLACRPRRRYTGGVPAWSAHGPLDDPSGASSLEDGLGRRPANHVPLTPAGFLERAATVYPRKPAVIHDTRGRMIRGAHAGRPALPGPRDPAQGLELERPPLVEAHYGRARRTRPVEPPDAFFFRSNDREPPLGIGGLLEGREATGVEPVDPLVHHHHGAPHPIGHLGECPAACHLGDEPIPAVQTDRESPIPHLGLQHSALGPRQGPEPHGLGHAVPPWGQRRRERPLSWPNQVGAALAARRWRSGRDGAHGRGRARSADPGSDRLRRSICSPPGRSTEPLTTFD
jgi:hypothetical protein